MNIAKLAVLKPVAVFFFILTIVISGVFSYNYLEVETFPEMKMAQIKIFTFYPGSSSSEIEELVTVPIETRLKAVKKIKDITSISRESQSIITVEFDENIDIAEASASIKNELLDVAARLPEEASDPRVFPVEMSDLPVLILSIVGNETPNKLKTIAENYIQNSLEKISGVGEVNINGGTKPYYLIQGDQEKLKKFNLSMNDLVNSVRSSNLNMPAGEVSLGGGRFLVRTIGAFKNSHDISKVPVDIRRNPPVLVEDVASVEKSNYPSYAISRMNGKPYVSIQVMKSGKANVVTVAQKCLKRIEEINKILPGDTKIICQYNLSEFVEDQMSQVKMSAVIGGFLAMIVLFLFLRSISVTLIIGLSIPMSILITLIVMLVKEVSLNYMTLAGIILALGMLVDDSIVILENIVRHGEMGKTPENAAIDGAGEISSAVLASTITTVIVFAPIFLMSEWGPGVFLKMMAFTLVIAVSASYIIAMTVVPCGCAWLRSGKLRASQKDSFFAGKRFVLFYRNILKKTLRHPFIACFLILVVFLLSFFFAFKNGFQGNFNVGNKDVPIYFRFAPGSNREMKINAFKYMENVLSNMKEVRNYYVWTNDGNDEGTLMASFGFDGTTEEMEKTKNKIRPYLNKIPGVDISFSSMSKMYGKAPVEIIVRGKSDEKINKAIDTLKIKLQSIDGISNVQTSIQKGKKEVHVIIDRLKSSARGVNENSIALTIRTALYGMVATKVVHDSKEIDVLVKLRDEQGENFKNLGEILVPSILGGYVPLRDLAEIVWADSMREIRKINGKKISSLNADVDDPSKISIIAEEIKELIEDKKTFQDVELELSGEIKGDDEGKEKMMIIAFIAIFLVYSVMAIQFNSFLHPLIIMATLPLALIGSNLSLAFFGVKFSIMAGIGVVLLAGIVVNDAIVLVDYIKQLRGEGRSHLYAILQAGTVRLRPILMTSITTIFGVIPMALGIGHGAEVYVPLGIALVGGLAFATVLTLIVIPLIYNMSEISSIYLKKKWNYLKLKFAANKA